MKYLKKYIFSLVINKALAIIKYKYMFIYIYTHTNKCIYIIFCVKNVTEYEIKFNMAYINCLLL